MSTSALICYFDKGEPTETLQVNYVYKDGYRTKLGAALTQNYNTARKAERLVGWNDYGYESVMINNVEESETRRQKYRFYDVDEEDLENKIDELIREYRVNIAYVFKDDKWWYFKTDHLVVL